MQPIVFISKIENGKTTCSAAIAKALRSFEGKWLTITIKERKRGRTTSQNAFYHGVIIPHMMDLLLKMAMCFRSQMKCNNKRRIK